MHYINMIRLLLLLFLATTAVFSCSNSAPNQAPLEQLDEVSEPVVETFDSTRLLYSWLPKYELKNTMINRIPTPEGYGRVELPKESFGNWLRHLPLKPGKPNVKLYDKTDKWNQSMHVAVVDLDVDEKDLQQCADAVMRLRAEYYYQIGAYSNIHFNYTNGAEVNYKNWVDGKKPVPVSGGVTWKSCSYCNDSYQSFRKYLIQIYNYAGTISLERELKPKIWNNVEVGDVVIWGGSPGHAIAVVDVALNPKTGDKIFLLAQSFMPAQESHVLKNPNNSSLSPWYSISDIEDDFITPEWLFDADCLRGWED